MKIVVNRCYGGFGLSQEAYKRLIELGIPEGPLGSSGPSDNKIIIFNDGKTELHAKDQEYWEVWTMGHENRTHPLLVQVVEELGEKANGLYGDLEVVEIPDETAWEIDNYDGIETIHEVHQSW